MPANEKEEEASADCGFEWRANSSVCERSEPSEATSFASPEKKPMLGGQDIFSIRRWVLLEASKLLFVGLFDSQFIKELHRK